VSQVWGKDDSRGAHLNDGNELIPGVSGELPGSGGDGGVEVMVNGKPQHAR